MNQKDGIEFIVHSVIKDSKRDVVELGMQKDISDFELPTVESSLPANKVRLHISDNSCESCQS